jgi:hypothetical protein
MISLHSATISSDLTIGFYKDQYQLNANCKLVSSSINKELTFMELVNLSVALDMKQAMLADLEEMIQEEAHLELKHDILKIHVCVLRMCV